MNSNDTTEGVKHDAEKLPYHLIPPELNAAVAAVLGYGAVKYAPRNWEKGMAWSRPAAALERHMAAWAVGEDTDAETGMPHLWHAACCVAFLIAYEARGIGEDDRPQGAEGLEAFEGAMLRAIRAGAGNADR